MKCIMYYKKNKRITELLLFKNYKELAFIQIINFNFLFILLKLKFFFQINILLNLHVKYALF